MDKEGFKKFLLARGVRAGTKGYINAVKTFEKWLFNRWEKTLDEANESDLRACEKLTRNPLYAYGVREYYRYLGKDKMVETINSEIIPKLPVSRPTLGLLSWSIYDDMLEKAKEKGVSHEKLTLLNLLWSEMKPTDILQLRKSDVDIERLVITTRTSGEFRVTPKAWDALRQYIADMSKRQKLFTMGIRNLQTLTKKLVGYTPTMIRNSCKDDLPDAGRKARFSYPPYEKIILEEEREAEEKLLVRESLLGRLVNEIRKFGESKWFHYQIAKIKDHKELQRLLEGYLLATFPDEVITHEFPFKGYGKKSIIDITIGDPKIPIEVKLAQKDIVEHLRKGTGQVKEFQVLWIKKRYSCYRG